MTYPKPIALSGNKIGIFGGTFDPPHDGHMLVAKRALRRLELDQIWWIPSPANPLKSRQPASISERINTIKTMISDPKMKVYDLESALGTQFTIDTVQALQMRYPARFVLIAGADILGELHRWRNWRELAAIIPIAAFARPGQQLAAGLSPFAQRFAKYRIDAEDAALLPYLPCPAWAILPGIMNPLSSTELRKQKERLKK